MKLKKFFKEYKNYILAFFIPVITLCFVYACLHFFGENSLSFVFSDLRAQYISFFEYFKGIFQGDNSLFYSFSNGLGGSMIGTFAYYLASPINFILLLFPTSAMTYGIMALILIKLGLACVTMYHFLKSHVAKEYHNFMLAFAACYALMMFNCGYYLHVMWLDAIYLLPLLLLGIDRLLKGKSGLFYGLILAFTIFTNYYIGYMICIFSCIYFLYQLILQYRWKEDKEKIIAAILKFGLWSLLGGLLTSIILVPTLREMLGTSKMSVSIEAFKSVFDLNSIPILSSFFLGTFDEILNVEIPYLYCGTIVLVLVFLYFFNHKIPKKEKYLSFAVLFLFGLSLTWKYLNCMWHGFNIPNCFEYRYTFLICFFLIYLAAKSFVHLKTIKPIFYWFTLLLITTMGLIIEVANPPYITIWLILITVVFAGLYLICLFTANHPRYQDSKTRVYRMMTILVVLELAFNYFVVFQKINFCTNLETDTYIDKVGGEIEKIKENDQGIDYRIHKNFGFTLNDSYFFNTKDISVFNSTLSEVQKNFFVLSSINYQQGSIVYDTGRNPFTDSILGVKYLFALDTEFEEYPKIGQFKFSKYEGYFLFNGVMVDVNIYQNPYALSLGYMVPDSILSTTEQYIGAGKINGIEFQNALGKALGSSKNLFQPIEVTKEENEFTFVVPNTEDFNLTFYAEFGDKNATLNLYINDELNEVFNAGNMGNYIIKNQYEVGQKLRLRVEEVGDTKIHTDLFIYQFDQSVLTSIYDNLNTNQLHFTELSGRRWKGNVTVPEDKTVLMMTIPYDKGWTIKVDGNVVEPIKLIDSFIGLELSEGEHTIEASYFPPGLGIGTFISMMAILGMWICYKNEKKMISFFVKLYLKYEEIFNYLIIGVLTTIVSILSYIAITKIFMVHYMVGNILSWIISILFAYFANKTFVFNSKRETRKEVWNEFYQFLKYRLLSLVIDVMMMYMLVSLFHFNDIFSKIIVQIVVIVLNYIFSKLFIFKATKDTK